jgi:hypothetical protein
VVPADIRRCRLYGYQHRTAPPLLPSQGHRGGSGGWSVRRGDVLRSTRVTLSRSYKAVREVNLTDCSGTGAGDPRLPLPGRGRATTPSGVCARAPSLRSGLITSRRSPACTRLWRDGLWWGARLKSDRRADPHRFEGILTGAVVVHANDPPVSQREGDIDLSFEERNLPKAGPGNPNDHPIAGSDQL